VECLTTRQPVAGVRIAGVGVTAKLTQRDPTIGHELAFQASESVNAKDLELRSVLGPGTRPGRRSPRSIRTLLTKSEVLDATAIGHLAQILAAALPPK